jgi:hypothetical protein
VVLRVQVPSERRPAKGFPAGEAWWGKLYG